MIMIELDYKKIFLERASMLDCDLYGKALCIVTELEEHPVRWDACPSMSLDLQKRLKWNKESAVVKFVARDADTALFWDVAFWVVDLKRRYRKSVFQKLSTNEDVYIEVAWPGQHPLLRCEDWTSLRII